MKFKLFLTLILILIILVVFLFFFKNKTLLCDYVELDSYLVIGDSLGFNVDTDAIYFGTTIPGSSVSREVYLNNTLCEKAKVVIDVEGDLKNWISISDNRFILLKEEGKSVEFTVSPPEDVEKGNYSSKIMFYF